MSYRGKIEGIIETIYQKNNYILDKEVKEVLLAEDQHKLISAPAGGTKTTLTQLMVNLEKLDFMVKGALHNAGVKSPRDRIPTTIPQNRILCIVYNKHNASDIDTVHARFYNLLTQLKYISPSPAARNYVEPGVYATTLHSYADKVVKDNLGVLKLRGFALSKDENINAHFRATVEKTLSESSVQVTQNLINDAKMLYDLYVGLMLYETPLDKPLTDSVQFELALQNTQIPPKYLRDIFTKYDARKKMLRLNEFSDMLRLANEVLKVPEIREHYRSIFNIIVADEVQDFTPLMFSIYSSLVGPDTKTITVGDGDQSIYSFLGAVENAIGNFEQIMGYKPTQFDLAVNRRCRKETMPFALNVIEAIDSRLPREIRTTKSGGELNRIEYKTITEQIEIVDKILKEKVTGNVGILFRNKNQSIVLSRYLYKRQIQANFINAHNCMQHRIYTLFIETLTECFISKSQKGLRLLNRLLPFPKKAIEEFFQFDEKTGVSATCPTAQLWGNLDLTPLYADSKRYFSIHEQVNFVQQVARESQSITASDCVERLLDLFYQNYFSYLTEAQEDPYTDLILQWAKEDLSVGFNLRTAVENLQKTIYKYMGSGRKVGKLNICTIHGTKGLEFNHVILNLEKDKVPPGLVLSPKAQKFQEDEENRLIYVAATRQIDSLTVLCNMQSPHRLADEKYFQTGEPVVLEPKFTGKKPKILEDNLLSKPAPIGRRRSMLLED